MKTFKEFITEAFDSYFPYKWIHIPSNTKTDFLGEFKTTSSLITFEMKNEYSPDEYEVSFFKLTPNEKYNQNYNMTGEGESFKVLSTVLKMIYDALQKSKKLENVNIKKITFSAEKDQGKGDKKIKTGRASLYMRMAKKFAKNLGKLDIEDEERSTYFTITLDK
ncbi:hypothetical protein GW796_09095 [archaeon]|nr:hypothetical protein [archaeon]NCT58887.1 hypothetical protein [archaeon]